jgi:hypothetical protein
MRCCSALPGFAGSLAPQRVDQPLAREDLAGVQGQQREDLTFARRRRPRFAVGADQQERPEDAVAHAELLVRPDASGATARRRGRPERAGKRPGKRRTAGWGSELHTRCSQDQDRTATVLLLEGVTAEAGTRRVLDGLDLAVPAASASASSATIHARCGPSSGCSPAAASDRRSRAHRRARPVGDAEVLGAASSRGLRRLDRPALDAVDADVWLVLDERRRRTRRDRTPSPSATASRSLAAGPSPAPSLPSSP